MTHRESTAHGPDLLFHSSSGHMRLSLEPDPSVPCAMLIPQHLKHVQGAASVSARSTLLTRVRHREDLSPMNRRHILLWQCFFEGILAALSVESNSSNRHLSPAYLEQPISLLAPGTPSTFPQISCWKVSHLQTQPTSVLEIPQAKTALRKGGHMVSLQNWHETGTLKKPHLRRGLHVIHWGNLGALVSLRVHRHPPSLS